MRMIAMLISIVSYIGLGLAYHCSKKSVLIKALGILAYLAFVVALGVICEKL